MGFFTIPLARLAGPSGRIIAVDVQPKMIASLKRRAARAGLADRVDARVTTANTMGIGDLDGKVDFTLAFAMVHEFPDAAHFFSQVARASKQGAQVLVAEPRGHVNDVKFAAELSAAGNAGFSVLDRPAIPQSISALLVKS